jgi:hypothetical protein
MTTSFFAGVLSGAGCPASILYATVGEVIGERSGTNPGTRGHHADRGSCHRLRRHAESSNPYLGVLPRRLLELRST